ncbi:hypothetical protein V6N11_071527 [Hibiscus sabdariffa]|uniref:CCHC-type domain-containing protein n=1 Tax=Hibiscus sabdariffa TaxID=183260 RepID=A0ABR2U0E8_9ROSI
MITTIGESIGPVTKIDFQTVSGCGGHFVRLSVSLDLCKPLVSKPLINGRLQIVEYESLPTTCFGCGKHGHVQNICPLDSTNSGDVAHLLSKPLVNQLAPPPMEPFGPWMMSIDTRDVCKTLADSAIVSTVVISTDARDVSKTHADSSLVSSTTISTIFSYEVARDAENADPNIVVQTSARDSSLPPSGEPPDGHVSDAPVLSARGVLAHGEVNARSSSDLVVNNAEMFAPKAQQDFKPSLFMMNLKVMCWNVQGADSWPSFPVPFGT